MQQQPAGNGISAMKRMRVGDPSPASTSGASELSEVSLSVSQKLPAPTSTPATAPLVRAAEEIGLVFDAGAGQEAIISRDQSGDAVHESCPSPILGGRPLNFTNGANSLRGGNENASSSGVASSSDAAFSSGAAGNKSVADGADAAKHSAKPVQALGSTQNARVHTGVSQ